MREPQLNSMLVPRGHILFMWVPPKQYVGPRGAYMNSAPGPVNSTPAPRGATTHESRADSLGVSICTQLGACAAYYILFFSDWFEIFSIELL